MLWHLAAVIAPSTVTSKLPSSNPAGRPSNLQPIVKFEEKCQDLQYITCPAAQGARRRPVCVCVWWEISICQMIWSLSLQWLSNLATALGEFFTYVNGDASGAGERPRVKDGKGLLSNCHPSLPVLDHHHLLPLPPLLPHQPPTCSPLATTSPPCCHFLLQQTPFPATVGLQHEQTEHISMSIKSADSNRVNSLAQSQWRSSCNWANGRNPNSPVTRISTHCACQYNQLTNKHTQKHMKIHMNTTWGETMWCVSSKSGIFLCSQVIA